ncbi:MAG: LacI family DNA-binding transcriptional regulator, partial [Acholeplasmataceae bacterium]
MANIKDVARKAGVGIATVSRVINHSGYVKKETREKIERVIRECGYVPNEIARSMTAQKNMIIAFMIPNTTHRFFGELLYHVEMELGQRGYKTMVCSSSEQLEKEIAYIDMLKKNRVDALILLTNNDIEPYLDRRFPLVSFDRRFKGVPCVTSDNYEGGVLAARHLIESGCQHLMFVGDDAQGGKVEVITDVDKRRQGFFDELKRQGYPDAVDIEYPLGNYITLPKHVHRRIAS